MWQVFSIRKGVRNFLLSVEGGAHHPVLGTGDGAHLGGQEAQPAVVRVGVAVTATVAVPAAAGAVDQAARTGAVAMLAGKEESDGAAGVAAAGQ